VPENAYGPMNGQNVLTHGVEIGVARTASTSLDAATDTFIEAVMRSEASVQRSAQARPVRLAARQALATPLVNRSPLGGQEHIVVYTTQLADGNLLYVLTVVPERDEAAYDAAFDAILDSIRLNDRRGS
jgi:hypothetical protein